MIVKDEETLEGALQLLGSEGPVRYNDQYAYIIITTPETLELQCRRALARNDIAVVVSRGREQEMEEYSPNLRRIRKERAEEEKKKIKEWAEEHPKAVERVKERME